MKITSSYGVELRKQNIPIRQTLDVYRSAVSYLVEIYAQVWEELEGILEAKKRFNEVRMWRLWLYFPVNRRFYRLETVKFSLFATDLPPTKQNIVKL